jgi:hypothetical protein
MLPRVLLLLWPLPAHMDLESIAPSCSTWLTAQAYRHCCCEALLLQLLLLLLLSWHMSASVKLST